MYYRRWTRMHLKPGMKYFIKYGVMSPGYDKYTYLMNMQNPDALQYRPHHQKRNMDKDLDTKLINNLFLKYPDLKFEPISKNAYPGQELNTFSYAYAFINEQKKLLKQGYTMHKAFEMVEAKYHEKMERKLDQSLLARGLAFGNRARSFLNVYQQQAQYQSRLKTQRTQRELEKYEQKLKFIREAAESDSGAESILNENTLSYDRMFYDVREYNRNIDDNSAATEVGHTQIPKNDSRQRYEFIDRLEGKFKNLFNQFYEHAASKDRLEGLTDSEILNQVQASPSKIKRQMRELIKYFENKNIKVSLVHGKVVVSGPNSHFLTEEIKKNKYLKIALLSESLNYEKPLYSSVENPVKNRDLSKEILSRKSALREVKPDSLTKQEKQTIKASKQSQMNLVINEELYFSKVAYKIYETQEERLLRLEIKYYDQLATQIYDRKNQDQDETKKSEKEQELKEVEEKRAATIRDFRRLKYRLESRYRNTTAEELLFPQHELMGKGLHFEQDLQFEDLLGHLRKKSEERRLTSLAQSKDNAISKSIRIVQISEAAIPEGTVTPNSQ